MNMKVGKVTRRWKATTGTMIECKALRLREGINDALTYLLGMDSDGMMLETSWI